MMKDLDAVLKDFAAQENLSQSDLRALAKWISNPDNLRYNKKAVGPEEFVLSPYYLCSRDENGKPLLYPEVMRCFVELNEGDYDEAVMTGGIGCGKTTLCLYTVAYQLYLLSLYDNPHTLFDLDPASELLFIFQSLNAQVAKSVDYERFKSMIDRSPYFREYFPYDRSLKSEMQFPNRIIVRPVSGATTATIGQNVIGGLIDEVNFMALIEKSTRTLDGSSFDQAQQLYDGLDRRRRSRFMKVGKLPGIVCLSSSKRYPGEFTDRKIDEAKKEIQEVGRTTTYIYDKRVWEVKPKEYFQKGWFRVFAGDPYRQPRILTDEEVIPVEDEHLVVEVPEEYRRSFQSDIMNALRDIAGISTLATHPFIVVTDKITKAMSHGKKSIFNRPSVDFVQDKLIVIPDHFEDKVQPRFAHVDLAITGDSAGVVVGYVKEFRKMVRGSLVESLPVIHIDGALEVRPPRNGEILFWKIRDIFYAIRNSGVPMRWVTFDTFQSTDSLQLLRQSAFVTGTTSMDRTITPYEIMKSALYDERLVIPLHEKLHIELASLEKDVKKNKVDHPPTGSKDIADALAGVVYGLTMRREIWSAHKVSVLTIPPSISTFMVKDQAKKAS